MTEHKELIVWQKAMALIVDVYKLTDKLPTSERYGLTDQLRRASVSIASNIAEGCKRSTDKDFKSFLHMALGSLAETETQLLVCQNLHLLNESDMTGALQQILEMNKMLISFIKKLS